MSYLNQLQLVGSALTLKRKKEYIQYNFGKLLNPILLKKNSTVLEIGPGMGEFIEYCHTMGVKRIDVVENDKSVLMFLKRKYKYLNYYLNQNIWKIDNKLKKYDVIMMTQVLEHIPENEHVRVLKTMFKHLNTNGIIIITVPNIGNPLAIYERYYDYTHKTAFTEHSLKQLVDSAGLKKINITLQPFLIPPYSLLNMFRSFMQFILHSIFKVLYILNGGVYPQVLTTNISLILRKKNA